MLKQGSSPVPKFPRVTNAEIEQEYERVRHLSPGDFRREVTMDLLQDGVSLENAAKVLWFQKEFALGTFKST